MSLSRLLTLTTGLRRKCPLRWINGLYSTLANGQLAGSWDSVSGHQANLYPTKPGGLSVDTAVKYYISKGVNPSKIVVGESRGSVFLVEGCLPCRGVSSLLEGIVWTAPLVRSPGGSGV